MDKETVFTKTAKGITQVNQRSASLSKDLMKVLKLIDGKSNFGQIMEKAELDKNTTEKALNALTKDGFARIFQTRKEEADPFAAEDDFDFTAPGKLLPGSTQRVVAGAANDVSELVRQQQKVEADKLAREQAHEQARQKARSEAEQRAKLEAEARSKQEAERKAMEQAQRAKEAADRAKAELDAKMREEEARKRVLADQQAQAKLSAEQKAKEEIESRRLVELRVKAEQESKALGEARARAEAEAAALARARAEADAAAKKQAEQATHAEAAMKARLKEEIEARIRSEMESLLRNELEEKTRGEMQAQILAEAKIAAKAELEDRLREERETIAKAEAEARIRAERDSNARAEMEAKKRAEAEARAQAETEARMKAEAETRQLRMQAEQAKEQSERQASQLRQQAEEQARLARDAEARMKVESEARVREQAEVGQRIEVERRAKIEAEARAKVEAEERERRERELGATIEVERKAKEEAEMRARIETRARETIAEDTRAKVQAELESNLEKRAEIEGKAQAKAYMQAKVKAEADEDDRLRGEQARKAREIADVLRTKVEPDEAAPESAPSAKRKLKRRGSLVKPILFGVVAVLVLGIVALHLIPMRAYTAKVERVMSAWLNDDVSIASMTFRLVPTPHLHVENVAVGKLLDAKASVGKINMQIMTLFGERPSIDSIELDNVSLSNEAVRRIPLWGRAEGKGAAGGGIGSIRLRGVKADIKPAVESFDAQLNFARDGALTQARLNSANWTLVAKPVEKGMDLDFTARSWKLPVGAAIPVNDVRMKGTLAGSEIVVPEFEASAMEGQVNGTLRVSWASGVKLESDLAIAKVSAKELIAAFTKAIAVTGKVDGNFALVTEGATVEQLFAAPRVAGKFKVSEGSISNIDLVAVMQSDTAGQRAGVTKFNELTGELNAADHHSSYKQVNLQGGVLRGNGAVDVGANSSLSGRLALEIRSQVAQDRGSFVVSGTVSRPIIRRGG